MGAWKCAFCTVNYPANNLLDRRCPKCGNLLSYYTNLVADGTWRNNLPEGMSEAEVVARSTTHPTVDSIILIYRDNSDSIHVAGAQLRRAYPDPHVGDVIRIAGKHYELEGHDPNDEWWIRRMEFDEEMADIRSLPETSGG